MINLNPVETKIIEALAEPYSALSITELNAQLYIPGQISEAEIKEAVLKLIEAGLIVPNNDWKFELGF